MRTRSKISRSSRDAALVSALALIGWFLGACSGGSGSSESKNAWSAEASELFGTESTSKSGETQGSGAWTIVLLTIPEEGADLAAMQTLTNVRTRAGLPEAYLLKRDGAMLIAYGTYPSGADARAKADLERVKAVRIGSSTPFDAAMLLPPDHAGPVGSKPEFNLQSLRKKSGRKILYTLQIGVYTTSDDRKEPTPEELGQIRTSAEQAAIELRSAGEEAFYYHGPHRSMITVGVFSEKDIAPARPGRQNPLLVMLRHKYPYNLMNGQTLRIRTPADPQGRLQESSLVRVPD